MLSRRSSGDVDLAIILSYLTFDGHLAKDLKGFYISSGSKSTIQRFRDLIKQQYGIDGRLEDGMGFGKSFKYRYFNAIITRHLYASGAPKGNKTATEFWVPLWIMSNREFARAYIRTAFDCEGSIWFEKQAKIRFGICKEPRLIANGLAFINDLKEILLNFQVETTKTWITNTNARMDGTNTNGFYFKIRQQSIHTFAREIGFSDRFKKRRLSLI